MLRQIDSRRIAAAVCASAAILYCISSDSCSGGEALDPVVFLQGIEAAREQIPPSRLTMRIGYGSILQSSDVELTVEFDGDRRRFTATHPPGSEVRIVYDGSQAFHFDGGGSVTIRDVSNPTSDYLFDPRLLGITTTYWWNESFSGTIPYRSGSQFETIGAEDVDGRPAWHLRARDEYDQVIDVWADADDNFKVYRYDFAIEGFKRNSTLSYYENENYPWLPSRVETRYFQANGDETSARVITVLEAEADVELPEDTWTLAGLAPPIGVPVSDLRIRERLGYWDGNEIVPDAVVTRVGRPPELAREGSSHLRTVIVLVNGGVIAFLFLMFIWRRRSRSNP